jgi:activator of HSP90 ATPase
VGGAFRAWGEHISGFNLVLQPDRKIVQAWRARDWWADHYSIATFDLRKVDGGTELRFTQIGVSPHRFDGHSRGWIETYWQPMQELFDKVLLATKREQQMRLPDNELIKENSEQAPRSA